MPGAMLHIILLNYQNIPVKKVTRSAPFTDGVDETPIAMTGGSRAEPRFQDSRIVSGT